MKKSMKKILMLTSLLSATLLAACGNNDSSEGSSDSVNAEKTVVTLALWNKNQEPVLRDVLDKFEEQNENITVELQLTPNPQYWTKLEAAASGSQMPDIVWMNGPNFINYASNGIIEPITSYLESSDIDLANYPESLVDLYTHEGELYGIPKDWDTTALWYNKDLFDTAGLDYPTDEWTFDEMKAAAEQLTDPSKGIYGVSANYMTQEGIYDIIPQNGGYVISEDRTESGYDKPEAIEGVEKYVALIEEGISPDLATQTDTGPRDLFSAGKLGMVYSASWNIPVYVENETLNADLVEVPSMKQKATAIHGLIYALNAKSEQKDEAWKVIEYLASEEANQIWAESGVVIPGHQGALDTWLESRPDLNLEAYVNSLEYSVPFPISKNSSVWNDYESEAITKIYSLEVSVEDGLKELAEKMNAALEKE